MISIDPATVEKVTKIRNEERGLKACGKLLLIQFQILASTVGTKFYVLDQVQANSENFPKSSLFCKNKADRHKLPALSLQRRMD